MPVMTQSQIDDLLHSNTICRLACVDYEGAPYVVPCWFTYAAVSYTHLTLPTKRIV